MKISINLEEIMRFLRNLFKNMHGLDNFGRFTIISSIILTLLGNIFNAKLLVIPGEILLFYSLFRCMSGNHTARFKENNKYLEISSEIRTKYYQMKKRKNDTRNNYFKCPKCKTYLSVPKGAGKVCIVCRKCNHQFIKKS